MKKSIALENPTRDANTLEIEVYYHLGGMNYFTGRNEPRGYYLSVTPALRYKHSTSYISFTGTKILLKEVKRKSAKAEAEAEEIAKSKIDDLIAYVCTRNGIVIPSNTSIIE